MTAQVDLRDGLIKSRLEDVGKVVLFASGKGGVGKSTLSAASACILSAKGSVGVLDMDIHGPSIPLLFGVRDGRFRESRGGLLPAKIDGIAIMSVEFFARGRGMPVRGFGKVETMRDMMAATDFGPVDTLIVDMPPGTGDEFITAIEMFREKGSIIFVTRPTMNSWNVTRRAVEIAASMRSEVTGVVQNMGKLSKGIVKDCEALHVKSLGGIGRHDSIEDTPVNRLRGTAFMRELKGVLEDAYIL